MAESTPPARPWIPLASTALQFAVAGQWAGAQQHLQTLADTHGSECLPAVLMAWIDTMLAQVPGPAGGRTVGLAFRAVETPDRIDTADEVAPATSWAGRVIMARLNDDEAQARALIDGVQSDEEWARNVAAVLTLCGVNIRHAQGDRDV